ncbi:MAG: hypothetical protein U1F65_10730 [Verrucomicrobiota bacterium]
MVMPGQRAIAALLLAVAAGTVRSGFAQTQPRANPNELMQLMLSQPATDVSLPVNASAVFDPPLATPGEIVVYRVSFNATEASIHLPEEIPSPAGLQLRRTVSGQVMQPAGGVLRPLTTFLYQVHVNETGQFTVPEYVAEVYGKTIVVPSATLAVRREAGAHEPLRRLMLEPAATNLYVGEPVSVRVLLPATSARSVEGVSQVQLNGDGFVTDKNAVRQSIQNTEWRGSRISAFIFETTLTPMAAGELTVSAQGFTAGMQFGGPIIITGQVTIPGGPPKFLLLDSAPVRLHVLPLPPGEPPGFNGAVGEYSMDLPQVSTNVVKVGEPLEIKVTVRGQQNLPGLAPPAPSEAGGWQIFPPVRRGLVGEPGTPSHGVSFSYTLIPMSDELRTTPKILFSAFNPRAGRYVDLSVQPVAVTVQPNGAISRAEASVLWSMRGVEPSRRKSLTDFQKTPGRPVGSLQPIQTRSWFPVVPIAPVLGLLGLWQWGRHRRHLELHPEIARRRKARRELRKARRRLNQTAAAGDVAGFRDGAINALRIAVAPHYPAEPRALVAADVLEQLPAEVRQGASGEWVRQCFAQSDAAAFGGRTVAGEDLISRRTELDQVLTRLEARLQ